MQSSERSNKRIAFVIPWFSFDITGGAESELKELSTHLNKHVEVEILTTCVKDFHSDWNKNFWKEKEYKEKDIVIRRFKTDKRDIKLFDQINYKAINDIPLEKSEEYIYIENSVRSKHLKNYILENKDRYDALIFIPYMFGINYDIIPYLPKEKTFIIPCLHNESYAYFECYKDMFSNCNSILLHTEAERRLAQHIYGNLNFKIVGEGVNIVKTKNKNIFKKKYSIDFPYILYAGRKDSTKNIQNLLDNFIYYKEHADKNDPLHLILIGPGEYSIPSNKYILDFGYLSSEEKLSAMATSLCLCQPSINESFSIVIMECWLQKRPILVNALCEVTKDHCTNSNGGLYYSNKDEFQECIRYLFSHEKVSKLMGDNGYNYVMNNYTWEKVIQSYLDILDIK